MQCGPNTLPGGVCEGVGCGMSVGVTIALTPPQNRNDDGHRSGNRVIIWPCLRPDKVTLASSIMYTDENTLMRGER